MLVWSYEHSRGETSKQRSNGTASLNIKISGLAGEDRPLKIYSLIVVLSLNNPVPRTRTTCFSGLESRRPQTCMNPNIRQS